jgi:hypothetical protein
MYSNLYTVFQQRNVLTTAQKIAVIQDNTETRKLRWTVQINVQSEWTCHFTVLPIQKCLEDKKEN